MKDIKQIIITSLISSILATIIVIALVANFTIERICSPDFIIGVLSLLVTILIGWQIYSIIDVRKTIEMQNTEISNFQNTINDMNNLVENIRQENRTKQEEMEKDIDSYKNYAYAITDFCQAYTKLSPQKNDYFDTYCKILNSYSHFIKTKENINWYASACIANLRDAFDKAKELREECDNSKEERINTYIEDIRKCNIEEFKNYWEQINDIEFERKLYLKSKTEW